MTREELRDELMTQLWRMNRMDMIELLREFIEGETAALWFMASAGKDRVSPSQISDEIRVSRARAANILRSLRSKGFVEMEIAPEDRRKMDVVLTPRGRRFLEEKYARLVRNFDAYVEVLGDANISELSRLLKLTADSNDRLQEKIMQEKIMQETASGGPGEETE